MSTWDNVQGEARFLGCWVRYLGQDADARHHAVAGPMSLLTRVVEVIDGGPGDNHGFDPLDPASAELLPLSMIAGLGLPLGAGDSDVEAGTAALAALLEQRPTVDEETGEVSHWTPVEPPNGSTDNPDSN